MSATSSRKTKLGVTALAAWTLVPRMIGMAVLDALERMHAVGRDNAARALQDEQRLLRIEAVRAPVLAAALDDASSPGTALSAARR